MSRRNTTPVQKMLFFYISDTIGSIDVDLHPCFSLFFSNETVTVSHQAPIRVKVVMKKNSAQPLACRHAPENQRYHTMSKKFVSHKQWLVPALIGSWYRQNSRQNGTINELDVAAAQSHSVA